MDTPDHGHPHTSADWYEIRVQGHLGRRWASRFEPMTLTVHDDGTTLIRGAVVDQAALHGLLHQLSDLGLPLVSVVRARRDVPRPEHHEEQS